jgi:flagellar hook-length control protein FliK
LDAPPTTIATLLAPGTGQRDASPQTGPSAGLSAQADLRQRSEEGPELSAGLQAWNAGQTASAASASHSLGSAAESELSVALRAEGLGAVQLHTRVSGDAVGAAITVERREAHAALSGDLPALHQALSQRQLRLDNISLSQGSPPSGAGIGQGEGSGRQQHGAASRQSADAGPAAPLGEHLAEIEGPAAGLAFEAPSAFDSQGRLSVQA